ncbi:MAG: hypothetical protein ACFE9L_00570 [Candidatus Hodarchaeota archaeon]
MIQAEEKEKLQYKETLDDLKAQIQELTSLVEPIYNKEFWESFLHENGTEFDGYGTLLYLYWKIPDIEEDQSIEEEKAILKLHSTCLEIRKVETDEEEGKEYHEVHYIPFHRITDVSITTDYIEGEK